MKMFDDANVGADADADATELALACDGGEFEGAYWAAVICGGRCYFS